ncbi:MAG: hypothetical protein AB7O24_27540 [Kofleriaceae bacterium]
MKPGVLSPWMRTRLDLMLTSELVTSVPADRVIQTITQAFLDAGWIVGADPTTPHQGVVVERPRARANAYQLYAEMFDVENAARELSVAAEASVAVIEERTYEEWRTGDPIIALDRDGRGTYEGTPWDDFRSGRHDRSELPAAVAAAMFDSEWPDVITAVERLADDRHGARGARSDLAAVEVHYPYEARWQTALEPLFTAIHRRLHDDDELEVPGLATFRRLRSDQEDFAVAAKPVTELKEFLNGGARPDVDLDGLLEGTRRQAAERALAEVVSFLSTEPADVLLGAGLALTVRRYPRYTGRNPRTGDPVHISPKRLPVFLGW